MLRVLGILAAVGLAMMSISGSEAEDRDEFYAIARGENPARRTAPAAGGWLPWGQARTSIAPPTQAAATRPRQMNARPRRQAAALAGADLSSKTFCVRSCDGYYFPIGPAARGEGRQVQFAACHAMCPGASVRLYTARNGSIENARAEGGQLYTATATAFRYRERLEPGCSCQARITQGLAHLSLTQDHTLRSGDVVMMDGAVRVFRDGGRFPYQPRDFVTAQAYGRLAPEVRRRVQEIREAQFPPQLRLAGIASSSSTDVFARAPRTEGLREMIALRGPVRQVSIEKPIRTGNRGLLQAPPTTAIRR